MVHVLMLEALDELTGCKGKAIVSVVVVGQSVLLYEFLQLWERDRADLEFTLNRRVLAE